MFHFYLHYVLGSELRSFQFLYVSSSYFDVFLCFRLSPRLAVLKHMYLALRQEGIDPQIIPHIARRSPESPLQVHTLPSDFLPLLGL